MQTTTNYGLKKPEETDFYNVQDFNDNMDILDEKVQECFQSVSNGKKLIASAITDKGVTTASDATFAVMAENIENIATSPKLQAKTATLDTTKTSAILTPDSGYDGLSKATVSITTQSKSAALSTSAQTIKPDSGKVLSAVSIPAIEGTAAVGDVLAGKTFNSATAGIEKPGIMVNRKGATVDAIAVSQDDTYTYFKTPAGCYSEESMVRTENSNLFGKPYGDGILTKCVSGTYHESSDLPDSLKITCGFKPSFICIQSIVDTTMSTSHVSIYRKNMSETVVLCASGISSASTLTISPTSFSIQSIEDDGFVVGKYYSNGATPKTVYWYATE